jgi:hypothetical protein
MHSTLTPARSATSVRRSPGTRLTSALLSNNRWATGASTLLISSLAFFLITLDILMVNLGLTSIGNELGGGTSGQQWVTDG